MRAFVALIPPADVVEDLSEFLAPRREARSDSAPRWTRDEHLHLTCAFLPSVPDRSLDRLVDALAEAAGRHELPSLEIAGAGAFPDPIGARVLWMGVEPQEGRADLAALAEAVRFAANGAGVQVQGGPFRPHLTVARFSRATEATRWLRILTAYHGPLWDPRELALVRSHLGQGPRRTPRYEIVQRLPLGLNPR